MHSSRRRRRSRSRSRSPRRDRSRGYRREDRFGGGGRYRGGERGGGRGGRRIITCYTCQQPGHHMRDCPQKGEFPRKKRRRNNYGFNRPVEEEQVEENEVEKRLQKLLVRIGEKNSQASLEKNLDLLAQALEEDILEHDQFIRNTLITCIAGLPGKSNIYATLIGLMNAKRPDFGAGVAKRLQGELKSAFEFNAALMTRILPGSLPSPETHLAIKLEEETQIYDLIRMLVRFAGCLVNTHVVDAKSFIQIITQCTESMVATTSPAYADFLALTIIEAIIWTGGSLDAQLASIMETLSNYITNTRSSYNYEILKVFTQQDDQKDTDFVHGLWGALQAFKTNDWKQESMVQPYKSFSQLADAKAHPIVVEAVPKKPPAAPYPVPPLLRLFQASKLEVKVSMVDRLVVSQYFRDTVTSFAWLRKEGVKQLLTLTVPFDFLPILIETLFSMLFTLPCGLLSQSASTAFIIDLAKAETKLQKILGRALLAIFNGLDSLDIECRSRFARWFAVHLSNFGFKFPWSIWKSVCTMEPSEPKRVFIRETLDVCGRLGVWDKVKAHLPTEFHALYPPQPKPAHKYAVKKGTAVAAAIKARASEKKKEATESKAPGMDDMDTDDNSELTPEEQKAATYLGYSKQLTHSIRTKTAGTAIAAWLENTFPNDNAAKLDLFMPCLLLAGAATFSHAQTFSDRYQDLLKNLIGSEEKHSFIVVDEVSKFWKHSNQHMMVVLGQLLSLKCVAISSVIDWVFQQTQHMHLPFVWDILFAMVDKRLRLLSVEMMARQTPSIVPDASTESMEVTFLKRQRRDIFQQVFNKFVTALTEQAQQAVLHALLEARFRQFARKYAKDLSIHWAEIQTQCLPADADEVVTTVFSLVDQLVPDYSARN